MNEDLIEQALYGSFRQIKKVSYSELRNERMITIEFEDLEAVKPFTKWIKKFKTDEYEREGSIVIINRDLLESLLFLNVSLCASSLLGQKMNGDF